MLFTGCHFKATSSLDFGSSGCMVDREDMEEMEDMEEEEKRRYKAEMKMFG